MRFTLDRWREGSYNELNFTRKDYKKVYKAHMNILLVWKQYCDSVPDASALQSLQVRLWKAAM